ncbi:MAG: hypothetical protein GF375_03865 [Candidatus Omnitrophica bacterium]|nr:hypothetical protein [Candidatus Omnitrophota bacterium]MBD3269196.1 hypothetical protein [Candidatus Omnitrophota bacterium]
MIVASLAVIKLALVSLFGFILYRKDVISNEVLGFLTSFVINFTIPFLIFSRLIGNSSAVLTHSVWNFLFLSLLIFAVGYFLGFLANSRGENKSRKEFISLISFQNAGYLPMNIAFFLFSSTVKEQFLVYIFLYLLGFNIIMWSIGSFLIFKRKDEEFKFSSLFNPPVISTFLALALIYSGGFRLIPQVLLSPLRMIGDTSFVLSMLVLGCWLAKVKIKGFRRDLPYLMLACSMKNLVLPLIFFIFIVYFNIFGLIGLFIILQASMPSAASLPVVVNIRGADSGFVSQGVFFTHLLSIFTIPMWLGLYLKFSGFPL